MKKAISLILVLIMLFSFCSCGGNKEDLKSLKMSVTEEVKSYVPYKAKTDIEKIIATNCYEGLFRFDSKSKLDLSGAVGFTVDKDNLVYTFKLNPNARWYMGKATKELIKSLNLKDFKNSITAEDYIFGLEEFLKTKSKSLYSIKGAEEFANGKTKAVDGVKAIDNFTLKITLKTLDPDFIYKLATLPIYPCNKDVFKALGKSYGKSPEKTLFNGAYYVNSASDDETYIERNSFYKGNLQVKNLGVHFMKVKSLQEAENNFLKGKTDIYISPSLKRLPGDTTSFSEVRSTWGIAFNCKSPKGRSGEIRDILLSSIDYNKISFPEFSNGRAKRIIPLNYTVGDSNYEDFYPLEQGYIKNAGNAQKNLAELLKSLRTNSIEISFYVPSQMKKSAEEILKDWHILFQDKIKVDLKLFELKNLEKVAKEAKYDMAILPLEAENKTAFGVIEQIKSAPCYYESKILNSLLSYIKATNHENASICTRAEKLIVDNGAFVPLFFDSIELYQGDNVRGVYIANGGRSLYLHSGGQVVKSE